MKTSWWQVVGAAILVARWLTAERRRAIRNHDGTPSGCVPPMLRMPDVA
jgi:hypothetical protein